MSGRPLVRRRPWIIPVLLVGLVLLVLTCRRPRREQPVAPPPDITGLWLMHWDGQEGHARFEADGTYSCNWQGPLWVGTWRIRGCRLEVVEAKTTAPGRLARWSVELELGQLAGRLSTGGRFELRRRGVEFVPPQP
jgi:hypothetical protein